jgi:DUF4097 and DUF4098 domain-containing protein YvlB
MRTLALVSAAMAGLATTAALTTLAPVASAQNVVGRNQDVWTWSGRVAPGAWFRFNASMGGVEVTEGSGAQVEVRAEKVLRRGRATDIGFIVMQGNDGATICAVYEDDDECETDGIHGGRGRSWRDRATLRVTIQLPHGVRIRAASGNGDVSVSGATDEVVASSGNGRVRVNGSGGAVRASSGNGAVTVEGARGSVDVNSGNGDVSITTSIGPVSANSGNGDITVSMDALRSAEAMAFTTGNGRITVTLPSDYAADVDASTGNGSIESDFPITVSGRITQSHVRGTIGKGGPRLRLVSGNGRIELRKGR